jgi:Ca2+-binding EF-hand superfamily protein
LIIFSVIFYYYDYSHVFAVFDRDHDGTIDFHEFLLAVAAGSPGDLDSHLKYVFEM